MRIWSLHPKYLDAKGLVACWRESLLAQNVLLGKTRGYKHHPQLERFKNQDDPITAIGLYLTGLALEATRRGYKFDTTKIHHTSGDIIIPVTSGQIEFEFNHLTCKLKKRDPHKLSIIISERSFDPHNLFIVVDGPREVWEVV